MIEVVAQVGQPQINENPDDKAMGDYFHCEADGNI